MKKLILTALITLLPYCAWAQVTFNTTTACPQYTFSNGNLTASVSAAPNPSSYTAPINASIPVGAKVYFEIAITAYVEGNLAFNTTFEVGAFNQNYILHTCGAGPFQLLGWDANSVGVFSSGDTFLNNASTMHWGNFAGAGNNVGIAIDWGAKKLWARVNGGQWDNNSTDNPATNTGGLDISLLDLSLPNTSLRALIPSIHFRNGGSGTVNGQFASASWTYTPPSGFSQLSLPPSTSTAGVTTGTSSKAINGNATSVIGCATPTCNVTFNMQTDFGAACTGTSNDGPIFTTANNVIKNDPRVVAGASVTLIIPSGMICGFGTGCSAFFGGLNDLTVVMTGVFMNSGASGGCLQLGNGGIDFTGNNPTAQNFINTVSAGANCVTMTTPGTEVNYPVGRWVIIGAMGFQGTGFPPNWGLFDYLRVESTPSGQVCFDTPLTNSYKQTWAQGSVPQAGQCVQVQCYANPVLVLMSASWAHTLHIIGGTWTWNQSIIYASLYSQFDNVTWNGAGSGSNTCYIPSSSSIITFNNSFINTCNVEVDKLIGSWVINGGHLDHLQVQSASINNITLNSGAIVNSMAGAHTTVCNNSQINSLQFGNSFGNASSFTGTNCILPGTIGFFYAGSGYCLPSGSCSSTFSGGTFSSASGWHLSFDPPMFWVPGTPIMASGCDRYDGFPATVGDNTYSTPGVDGGILSFATTYASVPPVSTSTCGNQPVFLLPDRMRNWACSNCTGSPNAISLSSAPAQNQPLFTYATATYTCTNNVANIPNSIDINNPAGPIGGVIGNMGTITINVSQADTSGNWPSGLLLTGPIFAVSNQSTGARTFVNIYSQVDLKVAGVRTITATTTTGAQPNDVLNSPGANSYLAGDGTPGNPNVTGNVSGEAAGVCPVFTLTYALTR